MLAALLSSYSMTRSLPAAGMPRCNSDHASVGHASKGSVILLLAFSLTLLIPAIALPELYTHTTAILSPQPSTQYAHIGPFVACIDITDAHDTTYHECARWTNHCSVRYTVPSTDGSEPSHTSV